MRGGRMAVMDMSADLARLALFVIAFGICSALETLWPARHDGGGARRRLRNLALMALGAALVRLALPLAALGTAAWAHAHGIGLLHRLAMPSWAAIVVAVVALDLLIYGQHVLFHRAPLLWRIHRVHHLDEQVDTSTGVRFHPLEILLSMLIKMGGVLLLGPAVVAVLIYEMALSLMSLITHCNLSLPPRLERPLRLLFITPDMHRIHHSHARSEHDSNYGNILSIWDRLFCTYTPVAAAGPSFPIGLQGQPDRPLPHLLHLPFTR